MMDIIIDMIILQQQNRRSIAWAWNGIMKRSRSRSRDLDYYNSQYNTDP